MQALGRAGSGLIRKYPKAWSERLRKLASLDWSRTNAELWEGRAIVGGRVQKGSQNITLTANAIKAALKVPLEPEEQAVEDAFGRRSHV